MQLIGTYVANDAVASVCAGGRHELALPVEQVHQTVRKKTRVILSRNDAVGTTEAQRARRENANEISNHRMVSSESGPFLCVLRASVVEMKLRLSEPYLCS